MHLLNIIVYWYAPNTTYTQQIVQVHSTQTDELINCRFVYVPIFRRYGTHHVLSERGEGDKKISPWHAMSMGISFTGLVEQLKFNIEVSKIPQLHALK